MDLLLLSNSTNHGSTPWAHAQEAAKPLIEGRTVLFVPYALHDLDGYTATIARAFEPMGARVVGIHAAEDQVAAVEQADAVYVGGGNTFRLLKNLHERGLVEPLQRRVRGGMPYLGASAGTNVACPTIRTTNDMPIVEPPTFRALGLVPFQINAHYLDADPTSRHMGETRETRLREFLEENEGPVLGIREGGWLRVDDEGARLTGSARLFRRGQEPTELEPGLLPF